MGRVLLIVLDGCGAGAAPDASSYGTSDTLANTLGNVAAAVGGIQLPNLEALGFGNITPMQGVEEFPAAQSIWGRLVERNAGKDTVAGHWELMGIPLMNPFQHTRMVFQTKFSSWFCISPARLAYAMPR